MPAMMPSALRSHDIFVAKQPIIDSENRVFGHELLFRSNLGVSYDGKDPDTSTLQVMANALHLVGCLPTDDREKIFINLPRATLLKEGYTAMPKGMTVFELLENVSPQPDVIAACRRLHEQGYELALDDFIYDRAYEPLLALADYVKVDFRVGTADWRRDTVRRLDTHHCQLLAEKVETDEEVQEARDLGFKLFQGYFFAKPKTLCGQDLSATDQVRLQLLLLASERELRYDEIERHIKSDTAVSFKLLRYLNCVARGPVNRVRSIRQALAMLGEDVVRKWIPLAILSSTENGDRDPRVRTCIIRARFCESICGSMKPRHNPLDLFRLGLMSGLNALYAVPLDEMVMKMTLPQDVRIALLGGKNDLAALLALCMHLEHGEWTEAGQAAGGIGLELRQARDCWYKALAWLSELGRMA